MEGAAAANPPDERQERTPKLAEPEGLGENVEAFEADELFRQVVETIDDVFWITDSEKKVMIYVSPSYERIWGRSRRELLESSLAWLDSVHPEDREAVLKATLTKQASGGFDVEYRIIRPDGEVRWIRDKAYPVRDEKGRVHRICGVARDITQGMAARLEAEAANARLELLLKHSPAVIYSRRPRHPFQATFLSENFEGLTGYPASQALAEPAFWLDHVHPEDREEVSRRLQNLEREGRCVLEYRHLNADGNYRWWHDEATLVRDVAGYPIEIVGFWVDVTERVEAGEARRRSESMFRRLIETSPDVITLIDPQGRIGYENPSVERVLGHKADQFVGARALDLVHPADVNRVRRAIAREIRQGQVETVHYRRRHRDGSWRWFEGAGRALSDGDEVTGVITSRDITDYKRGERERHRLQRERERLAARLLAAHEEERRWTALDIHDGPTQQAVAADMYLRMYAAEKTGKEAPEVEAYLERSQALLAAAIQELRRVISDLRPALLDEFGLAEALRGLAERTMAGGEGPRVVFRTNMDALRLNPTVESALYRIAQEAVSNAVKHSGSPVVEVRLWAGARSITATVKDRGRGFDAGMKTLQEPGHGLGLQGMRERAALIGGRLDIRTGPGGTIVRVTAPLSRSGVRDARKSE